MQQYASINDLKEATRQQLSKAHYRYLAGGSDDQLTLRRNEQAFGLYQIRPRRLVDVRKIDLQCTLFGETWPRPFFMAPVGFQKLFAPQGALHTARACAQKNQLMLASTVTNVAYSEIAASFPRGKPWFQLYPTTRRNITKQLIQQAERAGAKVLVITTDVPVLGNRGTNARPLIEEIFGDDGQLANLPGYSLYDSVHDPGMTWEIIPWIRSFSQMKIVLKGLMRFEDARLARQYGVDGIYISNHGARQLDSNLSTIECLEEIVAEVGASLPVLIDGGFRRGTDILKALALGATAVGIGRPFLYGLSLGQESGIVRVIDILQEELHRNMQLAGVSSLGELDATFVKKTRPVL
ncbi:MAG TPA: alpha-hydroxy acid oxidase [Saprospiraceae bacterium]|nr:alpha-hydroxy acid oxidase [Saprospiraceae bacterium]